MSTDDEYRDVAWRLIEWGRKRAEVEAVDRDALIREAHQKGMAKAEIARLTGVHWATVDRAVRGAAQTSTDDEAKEG
jgi:IS30 family transposase